MAKVDVLTAGGQAVLSFLDLIGWSEGTTTEDITVNDGYDVIVTGEVEGSNGCLMKHEEIFSVYVDHPFADGRKPVVVREATPTSIALLSTAAGRYQILFHYFEAYKGQLSLPDFSPVSQDLVALQMMKEVRAIDAILDGDVATAITLCSSRWASMPGNSYGQGGHAMDVLLARWAVLTDSQS